ncbi:MAG TPA: 30S ribosomal protein S7 [Bacteroidia bacterium]|jgi:small subunit ribosomal protein S7|nr:30S ribosomal protein S7 [Bacteroidia bacterium]
MRKTKAKKRPLLPDPKFHDQLVTRFINSLMYDGKKNTAYEIFYEAIETVAKRTNEDGLEVFKKGLANVTPQVEVRSRRVGGATFQIPSEVRPARKLALAIKWMITYSRARNEKSMAQKLAGEIVASSKEEGAAFKKKEDVHKMAEANKAFSHFRF